MLAAACHSYKRGTMSTQSEHNPRLAIALMITATVFIATSTLMAKLASDPRFGTPLHPLQISNGRYIFAFALISSVFVAMRGRISKPHLKMHTLRSALGWGGVTLMFTAVGYIPMADATAISFLNPVFAMVLAIPLLGEKVGRIRWSAAVIALLGAFILLRPSPQSFEFGALFALGAAVLLGAEIIVIKRLSALEGPLQILLVNNAIGVALSSLAVISVWQPPTLAQWGFLAGVGFAMAAAQTFFVNAVKRADASFIVPFSFFTLVFAAGFDAAIFAKWPDAITVLGAGIILSGAGLLAWRQGQIKQA